MRINSHKTSAERCNEISRFTGQDRDKRSYLPMMMMGCLRLLIWTSGCGFRISREKAYEVIAAIGTCDGITK
jgi:hypothetical protein